MQEEELSSMLRDMQRLRTRHPSEEGFRKPRHNMCEGRNRTLPDSVAESSQAPAGKG